MNKIDPSTALADDAFLHVLSYVDPQTLACSSRVSKSWHKCANDHELWNAFFQRIFPSTHLSSDECSKNYIAAHSIFSTNQLSQKVTNFIEEVELGQRGKFYCFFPFEPSSYISLDWKLSSSTNQRNAAATEIKTYLYFWMKECDQKADNAVSHASQGTESNSSELPRTILFSKKKISGRLIYDIEISNEFLYDPLRHLLYSWDKIMRTKRQTLHVKEENYRKEFVNKKVRAIFLTTISTLFFSILLKNKINRT